MKWSKEPPTEPGWYWVRETWSNGNVDILVRQVFHSGGHLCVWVEIGREQEICPISEIAPREWAGPIPQPEEEV